MVDHMAYTEQGDYIVGDWTDSNGSVHSMKYKKRWGSHTFSDAENNALLAGNEITFSYNGGRRTGHLQYCVYNGREYFGFKCNTPSSEYEAHPVYKSNQTVAAQNPQQTASVNTQQTTVQNHQAVTSQNSPATAATVASVVPALVVPVSVAPREAFSASVVPAPAAPVPTSAAAPNDPYSNYKTVKQVSDMIAEVFSNTNEFRSIYVKGEVAGKGNTTGAIQNNSVNNPVASKNGKYFFSIKEDEYMLPCVIWDQSILSFILRHGQQVAIKGKLEFWRKNGDNRLIVTQIEDMGQGTSSLARQMLINQLQQEGCFDVRHKKPLPPHIQNVGIITSNDGKAIQDITCEVKARNPGIQLYLYSVSVQGKNAINDITKGISVMDKKGYDVLIIARGGGDEEHQMRVFDSEAVARAVFQAKTPIISAVGHEGNRSITDDVADIYANAPTAAGTLVSDPDIKTILKNLENLKSGIQKSAEYTLKQYQLRLRISREKLEQFNPDRRLKEQKRRLSDLQEGLDRNLQQNVQKKRDRFDRIEEQLHERIRQTLERKKQRFDKLLSTLHAASPTAKLINGFGYISTDGKPVKDISDVKQGDTLSILIHNGTIEADVLSVTGKTDDE